MRRLVALGVAVAALGCAGSKASTSPLFAGPGDLESILRDLEATGPAGAAAASPDADHDAVPDAADHCPEDPELEVGEIGDGCPDPDEDGDGIANRRDPCPSVPGITCRKLGSSARAPGAPRVVHVQPMVLAPAAPRVFHVQPKVLGGTP